MYQTRLAGFQPNTAHARLPEDPPASALPQPVMRLTAMASIGVGAGLFSASAPTEVLILTFAPALIAMLVIAVKSMADMPETARVDEIRPEGSDG